MAAMPVRDSHDVVLRAENLSKRFGRHQVLDDVSFELHRGEVVGIIGPNGSGKTTLLKICVGLLAPDEGRVVTDGPVGYCPQLGGLIELLTPAEHFSLVGAGRGMRRADARSEGSRFGRFLDFDGADRKVAEHLSGGTRQKLNVCLAQIGDPPLLVLDEPYQGFDRESYVNLWTAVERWRDDGRGVLVVTHRDDETNVVDRFIELDASK